jgi:hypothetical protein
MGKAIATGARTLVACLLCVAAASALSACKAAQQSKEHELDLAQITRWLPGNYNNNAQHEADVRAGKKPPHEALAIAIVPIDSPIMGGHAFYLQEMAADDPRRVMLQQILTFEQTGKDQIRESVATLTEPRRWRDAQLTPDILTAMTPDDLTPMSGCDLFWKRSDTAFIAANDPRRCHASDRMSDAAARNELRAELKSTELSLSEQSYDESGALVAGRADEPFYRFHKSSEKKP